MKRALAASVALLAAAATPALAAPAPNGQRRVYRLEASATVVSVSESGNPAPPVGGSSLAAGPLSASGRWSKGPRRPPLRFGAGVLVARTRYHSPRLTANVVLYEPLGTIHLRLNGTGTVSGSEIDFGGTGTLVRGSSGIYRGASGAVSFSASQPNGSGDTTYSITGVLSLPAG